jgi:FMN-dependent NADH-azoreductase
MLDSKSSRIADIYINALVAHTPDLAVDTLNVWNENLPPFDGDKVAAKMRIIGGEALSGANKTAWDDILRLTARFIEADQYVFAVPMWNSGVPYPLKHYIDLVHQPDRLWRIDPDLGYLGLLKDKRATLVLTAGAYAPNRPKPSWGIDHHSTYLHDWLRQAGVDEIDEIRFDANLFSQDPAGDLARIEQTAVELARQHAKA